MLLTRFNAAIVAIGWVIVTPSLAAAQASTEQPVSVRERSHPEYDATNLHAGSFIIAPSLTASAEGTDNLYARSTDSISDLLVRLEPSMTIKSDWSRNALSAYANASIDRYADHTSENSESWVVGAQSITEILSRSRIVADVSYAEQSEPRTAAGAVTDSIKPITYSDAMVGGRVVWELNRLRLTGSTQWEQFDYQDGVTAAGQVVDQSYRNRDATRLVARAEYLSGADSGLYAQVGHEWRQYETTGATDRTGETNEFLVGVTLGVSHLVRGEFGVGWQQENFDNPLYNDFSGYNVQGRVEWLPTPLTTVTFDADRGLQDAGIATSPGVITGHFGVTVDHELLRNAIITGSLGLERDKYLDIDRSDNRYTLGLRGTYLLDRNLGLNAGISHLEQDSSDGESFSVNRVSIGLTAKY